MEGGLEISARELDDEDSNQFMVFQINNASEGKTILEASEVAPHFPGSDAQPDMYLSIEMQSFHLAQSEQVDKNTRATMRLVVGKDKSSRDRAFDDVFWTVSAGLDLYNKWTKQKAKPDELKADFNKALGNRPIEVAGGLANMQFEVVKHSEPKWWQRIFGFLRSDAGRSLTSVVGFPAITSSAIQVLDELFNRLDRSDAQPLFKSRPMILALSEQAKLDYSGGISRIKVGCMNPGFCVFARRRDYHAIANADALYYPHLGILAPSSASPADVASGNFDNPLADITYAVFKVNMIPTKLELRFNFGGRIA
ncbi:MAG: hypothetical protein IPN20_03625 [Haliscomenobacter sp.]|nr:hypothetical protein [Haliscomenobacter sp.]